MIAEGVAGSQEAFVQRMNEAARQLGMSRTNFANVNGLPDDRQSPPRATLPSSRAPSSSSSPEHADLFTTVQVQVGKQIMRTHNGLLVSLPGADGMKTGFIRATPDITWWRAPPVTGGSWSQSCWESNRELRAACAQPTCWRTARLKRYFWKSLFGTSIDGLAIQQASLTDGPPHLKDAICGVAKPKPSGMRKVSRKGGSKKRSTVSIGAN